MLMYKMDIQLTFRFLVAQVADVETVVPSHSFGHHCLRYRAKVIMFFALYSEEKDGKTIS